MGIVQNLFLAYVNTKVMKYKIHENNFDIAILNYRTNLQVTIVKLFNKSDVKLLFQYRKIAFKIFPRASMFWYITYTASVQ